MPRLALLAPGISAIALGVVGCAQVLGTSGDLAFGAPRGDAGVADDGSGAASDASDASRDGASDGAAPSWVPCKQRSSSALDLCDDFDDEGETAGSKWSFYDDGGSSLSLVGDDGGGRVLSAPRSLGCTVVAGERAFDGNLQYTPAVAQDAVGTHLALAFSFRLESGAFPPGSYQFVTIGGAHFANAPCGTDGDPGSGGYRLVSFNLEASGAFVFTYRGFTSCGDAGGIDDVHVFDTRQTGASLAGAWHRAAFAIDPGPCDGGKGAAHAVATLDGAIVGPACHDLETSPLALENVTGNPQRLQLGVGIEAHGPTAGGALEIDDVDVEVR